jgi:hypothetical protein
LVVNVDGMAQNRATFLRVGPNTITTFNRRRGGVMARVHALMTGL